MKNNETARKELATFIKYQVCATFARSKWFNFPQISIYLRAGKMHSYQNLMLVPALTIANVVVETGHRRHGVFSQAVVELVQLGRMYGYKELQIENAIADEMLAYCKSRKLRRANERNYWLPLGETSGVDTNTQQVD